MPGGSPAAWPHVKDIFQKIAAKVEDGSPCCDWVGENGAGHYVKMVHNGIEYGDMQLICEAYHLMKTGLGLSADQMHQVFAEWNKGELDSYLIEITRDILAYKDTDGQPLVDKILDTAGQKGTGKWTVISSQDLGIPDHPDRRSRLFALRLGPEGRARGGRQEASRPPKPKIRGRPEAAASRTSGARSTPRRSYHYTQGYMLMRAAAKEYKWNLNYGGIALMWRGGCIIRSAFLGKIKEAFDKNPKLRTCCSIRSSRRRSRTRNAPGARSSPPPPARASRCRPSAPRWRSTTPIRSERLPANLLQAQRDYFGAHTYERVDQPRGQFFHTNWTGHGGTTASSTYTV